MKRNLGLGTGSPPSAVFLILATAMEWEDNTTLEGSWQGCEGREQEGTAYLGPAWLPQTCSALLTCGPGRDASVRLGSN